MYTAAPRLDPRLAAAIDRLDDRSLPIAETYRRCRAAAAELGIPRPSYERVRLHVHELRRNRERARVARETILDVLLNQRRLDALNEIL